MAIMRALNGDNSEGKSYFFFETDRIRNAKVLPQRKASPVCKTIERGHNVHCKCLQGFTGTLWGNRSVGISNLWGLHVYPLPTIPVILKFPHSYLHCNICREFDFTGILWWEISAFCLLSFCQNERIQLSQFV